MRYLLGLLAALCIALPAQATITYDSTACSGGTLTNCPHATVTGGVATTLTVTTPSFSTAAGETILILLEGAAQAGSTGLTWGTPTFSGGSFTIAPSIAISNAQACSTGTVSVCVPVFYAVSSAALSSVTVSATLTAVGGNARAGQIQVLPLSGRAVLGNSCFTHAVTTLTCIQTGWSKQASIVIGGFVDGSSSASRTAAAGSTVAFETDDATDGVTMFAAYLTTPLVTYTQASIGSSSPSVTNNSSSASFVEIVDATVNAGLDPGACIPGYSGANMEFNQCKHTGGTTATAVTTGAFSTVAPVELICVTSAQQGVGNSATAITDSGISKSTGWTKIGNCNNSTTNDSEAWCAITSAALSANTITATFTATSVASSAMEVYAFQYAKTTALPSNFVCNTGTSGAASLSITPAVNGSVILESGADTADTTPRTATTTPPAGIGSPLNGTTGYVWVEGAWTVGTSAASIGTSAPTSTLWALGAVEVQPFVAATGPVNSGMFNVWGLLRDLAHWSPAPLLASNTPTWSH